MLVDRLMFYFTKKAHLKISIQYAAYIDTIKSFKNKRIIKEKIVLNSKFLQQFIYLAISVSFTLSAIICLISLMLQNLYTSGALPSDVASTAVIL